MRTTATICGLLLVLFSLALNGCASSKKTRCSCPNFRGSRAIYGKADVKPNSSEGARQADDFRLSTTTIWR